ncbi:hypothetical protein HO133_003899 [Letharia lupina]|uniref:Uncharacterized protein n=1 Tax=Letharia lupina TaxID=560253 RepID=A0A8H6C9G6_9LECA|nr:uncharacterized protein HO133_003899 [Letharia lupina]KAF6219433.1 hypothetical protein HO133_003899 [Letharia lupina]
MDNSLIPLATEGAAPNPPEAVKQCKKRTKWSKPTDPSLEQRYGSKEIALDAEEFSKKAPPQLCLEDQAHWERLRPALLKFHARGSDFKNTHSFQSRLTQIRRSLRGLQEVSNGTRARFKIFDHKIRPKGKTAARVGKGPGQIMHERFGWMRVVCGPSPTRSRGDGSSRHPIMLD